MKKIFFTLLAISLCATQLLQAFEESDAQDHTIKLTANGKVFNPLYIACIINKDGKLTPEDTCQYDRQLNENSYYYFHKPLGTEYLLISTSEFTLEGDFSLEKIRSNKNLLIHKIMNSQFTEFEAIISMQEENGQINLTLYPLTIPAHNHQNR